MPCGWILQTVQNLSSLFYWLHNCCILQQWKRSCSHVAYRSHVSWPRSISQSCFSFLCLHLRKRAAGKSSQITTGTEKNERVLTLLHRPNYTVWLKPGNGACAPAGQESCYFCHRSSRLQMLFLLPSPSRFPFPPLFSQTLPVPTPVTAAR